MACRPHATLTRGCLATGCCPPCFSAWPPQCCCCAWRLRWLEGTVDPSWLVRLRGGGLRVVEGCRAGRPATNGCTEFDQRQLCASPTCSVCRRRCRGWPCWAGRASTGGSPCRQGKHVVAGETQQAATDAWGRTASCHAATHARCAAVVARRATALLRHRGQQLLEGGLARRLARRQRPGRRRCLGCRGVRAAAAGDLHQVGVGCQAQGAPLGVDDREYEELRLIAWPWRCQAPGPPWCIALIRQAALGRAGGGPRGLDLARAHRGLLAEGHAGWEKWQVQGARLWECRRGTRGARDRALHAGRALYAADAGRQCCLTEAAHSAAGGRAALASSCHQSVMTPNVWPGGRQASMMPTAGRRQAAQPPALCTPHRQAAAAAKNCLLQHRAQHRHHTGARAKFAPLQQPSMRSCTTAGRHLTVSACTCCCSSSTAAPQVALRHYQCTAGDHRLLEVCRA